MRTLIIAVVASFLFAVGIPGFTESAASAEQPAPTKKVKKKGTAKVAKKKKAKVAKAKLVKKKGAKGKRVKPAKKVDKTEE